MFERIINPLMCCIVLSSVWIGCSVEVSLVQTEEDLSKFHIANAEYAQPVAAPFEDGVADFYMDYSGSVSEGMEKSYPLLDLLSTVFAPADCEGFAVHGRVQKSPLQSILLGQGDAFFARNMNNYRKDSSRIDIAIEQIVKRGRTAVFLTDFRKEDGTPPSKEHCGGNAMRLLNYHNGAWAAISFQKWLQAGHGIEIYASKPWVPRLSSQSPRLFLMVFVQRGDTGTSSVSARIKKGLRQNQGIQWGAQLPVSFQLEGKEVSLPETQADGQVRGLRAGLRCLQDWHRPEQGYSYYRFQREELVDALEDEQVLVAGLKVRVESGGSTPTRLTAYQIPAQVQAFFARKDSGEAAKADTVNGGKPKGERPASWEKSKLFTLRYPVDDRRDTLEIRVNQPLEIPMAQTFYCIDLWEDKSYIEMSRNDKERLTWSYDGCEMKALSGSLANALQNSPSQKRVLYSIYVEILN